jgi:tetratricopeptide (TPR) repeat protein
VKSPIQIFLCYAREDETQVKELYQRLSAERFKPWMDRLDILPGRKWKSSIRQAIRQSDFFLACLSKNSVNKRGYIQQEIKEALDVWQEKLDSDVYLIPTRLEECQVPESLQDVQWVDLFYEEGWQQLLDALNVGLVQAGVIDEEEARYLAYQKQGNRLRDQIRFELAEAHYRRMLQRFPGKEVETCKSLGFTLLRQGEVEEAIAIFNVGRTLVAQNDYGQVADLENLLGQANRAAGHWHEALQHYFKSARAFIHRSDRFGLAGVYTNRGHLYSLQAQFQEATEECRRAVDILNSLPADSRQIQIRLMYANMNLGTVHRRVGQFEEAIHYYGTAEKLAQTSHVQEVACKVWQQLGITYSLKGRFLREEQLDLNQAARDQFTAFDFLSRAFQMAQESEWKPTIADALGRLAKVYEEIDELERAPGRLALSTKELCQTVDLLDARINEIQSWSEFQYDSDLLLTPTSLVDFRGNSAKLFWLSALLAETTDFYRTLDSFLGLNRMLIKLQRYDLVPILVRRLEKLKGLHYQEGLFPIITDFILADLDFEQMKHDAAFDRYRQVYARAAKLNGFVAYLLPHKMRDLEQRMFRLPPDQRLVWCDLLADAWLDESVSISRPGMVRLLEDVRMDALQNT